MLQVTWNDVYLQSFIITSAARFLTRSIIRRKYNTGGRKGDGMDGYQGYTTRVVVFPFFFILAL